MRMIATLAEIQKFLNDFHQKVEVFRNMLNRFGDLWVFGKDVKGQEVYIKICYGLPNRSTICISFHVAEFPMNYPYKKGGQS